MLVIVAAMSDVVLDGLLAPPAVVAPPQPTPPPHSLLGTAIEVRENPVTRAGQSVEEWTAGFTFLPEACDDGGVWVPCVTTKAADLNPNEGDAGDYAEDVLTVVEGEDDDEVTQLKSEFDATAAELFIPFVVEGSWKCNTSAFHAADYLNRATRHLEIIQHKQIELEFWTGHQMNTHPSGAEHNMALVKSTPAGGVLNPGGSGAPEAVGPRAALSLLQQGLANCNGGARGMIHMTPYLAEMMAGADMLKDDGQRLSTKTRGTWVVAGAGYPGTGPSVVGDSDPAVGDDTLQWAYATGIVNYRLSKVRNYPGDSEMARILGQGMDRRRNKVTYRAERFAAAVWDPCCTVAVLVDLSMGVC